MKEMNKKEAVKKKEHSGRFWESGEGCELGPDSGVCRVVRKKDSCNESRVPRRSGNASVPHSWLEVKKILQCYFLKNANLLLPVSLYGQALTPSLAQYGRDWRQETGEWVTTVSSNEERWGSLMGIGKLEKDNRQWTVIVSFEDSKGQIKWFVVTKSIMSVMDNNEINSRHVALVSSPQRGGSGHLWAHRALKSSGSRHRSVGGWDTK